MAFVRTDLRRTVENQENWREMTWLLVFRAFAIMNCHFPHIFHVLKENQVIKVINK